MADHVATINPPRAAAPSPAPEADSIALGAWWPALSVSAFRSAMRVNDVITDVRIRHAMQAAIQTALIDLADFELAQMAAGFERLADVPARQIDGQSAHILCWQRAIFALAKAELVETHRDYDATGDAERRDDWVDPSITQLQRDAAHAIRDIKGRRRTFVELI